MASESDTPTTRLPSVSVPTPPALDDPGKVGQVMNPPKSPTGTPWIPPQLTPIVVGGGAVLTVLGEALTDPAPWTPVRIIGVLAKVLAIIGSGIVVGGRKNDGQG